MTDSAGSRLQENIEAFQAQPEENESAKWFDSDPQLDEAYSINEYEITTSPNDFNIKTMYDFIKSGAINIPGFQRNYVWDIKRASKLIESIIIGLRFHRYFSIRNQEINF